MRPVFLAVLLLPLPALADKPITLPEAYNLALARSEQIALSGATYEETMARADELFSNVLPRVTVMGTETFQDVPRGQSGLFLQRQREQGWVTLHQPLFSGFREFLAFRAAKGLGRAAELSLERAKHLLYRDVARAYLDLLAAQDAIRIRSALVDITTDRVKDLKGFRKIGRARSSELLAAESSVAQQLAALERSRADEQIAQFKLAFLTGVEERAEPAPLPPDAPAPALDGVIAKSRARPDVSARRAERESAEQSVSVYSRKRWPTLSADANYYFARPPSFTSDVKWDATLTGSLPLYTGGEVKSQVAQMKARLKGREAALSESLRIAELEAKSAHQELLASASVVAALDNAARLADENAKAQSEDYRLGQVTNLDVLGSLNTLQQTRLQHNEARIEAFWSRVRLEVAAGVPGGSL